MAYTFCPLKQNHFTKLVAVIKGRIENTTEHARPLRVAARWQRELLCVMAFQGMEWASMDEADVEDFDLSNITDDENENEFGTPVFDTDEVVSIRSDETDETEN